MADNPGSRPITDLLDALDSAAVSPEVSVEDLLHAVGEHSITPVILVIALLLVSPLSGIPGLPTVSAVVMVALAAQWLGGRRHLWLPGALLRRRVSVSRLRRATVWLRRPSAWVERHTHARMRFLTRGPSRLLVQALCLLIPAGWPLLELMPMLTSIGALTLALLTFGLMTDDGLYVLFGFGMLGVFAVIGFWIAG